MKDDIPAYNVKAVIHETGLTPATLRAWERRYGLIKPHRSPGGHRLYTIADIALLKWLMARQAEGLSISHAVEMWRNQHQTLEKPQESTATPRISEIEVNGKQTLDQFRSRWIEACLAFDESSAEQTVTQALALTPPEVVCTELFQKGLAEIGSGWYNGKVTIQQEHFASALVVRRLNALLAAAPPPTRSTRLLAACPPGEAHDLALLMLAFILRWRGWDVIYLGANVPIARLGETLKSAAPGMVISVAQTLPGAAALRELGDFLNASKIPLAYGGGIFNQIPALTSRIPGHYLGHELNAVPLVVENLFIHQPTFATPEPISPGYEKTLQAFQEKQALITTMVSQSLLDGKIHRRHIDEANHHFTRAISSALALGDIRFLDESVGWLNGLMENYGLALAQASRYYTAYHQAVAVHLADQAGIILEWLSGVHRFKETETNHA